MNIPLNIDWQQILLHLFNFAILAGGLYLLLYRPVQKFMAQRIEYYKKIDEETTAKKAEAVQLEASHKASISKIEKEVSDLRANAMKKAESAAAEQLAMAQEQAEKIVSDARQQAQAEKRKILASAQQEIAQLAVIAAEKVLSENMYTQFANAVKDGEAHE